MNENVRQLRKLALILDVSGTAIPLSNTKLYQGGFGYVLLQVYVPVTQNRMPGAAPLCTAHRTTIDNAGNRKQFNLDKYNLIYVENTKLNGAEYMIFENPLPKAFTADAGEIEIVINYSEIKENDLGQQVIVSRLTTNIYHAQVAEGGVSDSQANTDLKGQEVAQINANTIAIEQMQDNVEALLQPPDVSEADNVGIASVEITEDGNFKFINIKGADGEKGDKPGHNWDDTSLQFENPDGTYGEFVDLKGEKGDKGDTGLGLRPKAHVDTYAELPPTEEIGVAYSVGLEPPHDFYVYYGSEIGWINEGQLEGEKGEPGDPNILSIGTVTSGAEASATITGDSPSQILNLVLPKGDKGDTGEKGDRGGTYFYNAEYSYDDVNNAHVLVISEAAPDIEDNISICTKLGQTIAIDDDVKIIWDSTEWDVKVYDAMSGDLTAVTTQNPITFTAGGSQSQLFFRTGELALEIGDITSQDKSEDDKFLPCDGRILELGSEDAITINEVMPPTRFSMYLSGTVDCVAIMYDGEKIIYATRPRTGSSVDISIYSVTPNFTGMTYQTSFAETNQSTTVPQLYAMPYRFFAAMGRLKRCVTLLAWDERIIWSANYNTKVLFMRDSILIAAGEQGLLSTSSDNGNTWTARSAQFGTDAINGIAYGNGILMAVGGARKISVSLDNGATWTSKDSGETTDDFFCINFADGKFYIGGMRGKIITTTNGDSFESINLGTITYLCYIVHNGNYFIAKAAGNSSLYISTTGEDWTPYSISENFSTSTSILAYHAIGKFISLCTDGSGTANPGLIVGISQARLPVAVNKYIKIKE